MNLLRRQRRHIVHAVLLIGGNFRSNDEYKVGFLFSLEALEAKIKSEEVLAVAMMPGWLLVEGVNEMHSGYPIPGWI